MASNAPIYSRAAPKSSRVKQATRATNAGAGDAKRHNAEGWGTEHRYQDPYEVRRSGGGVDLKKTPASRRNDAENDSKVEAYLHSVHRLQRQAQLRSLNLTDVATPRSREKETNCSREHRRERDNQMLDLDGPLSPQFLAMLQADTPGQKSSVRRSSSWQKDETPSNFCREWIFQKLAHCLEQRHISKTCGVLILGDAGSGKTVLCQELSNPGSGPAARQQRALNRRLLARHFLQSHNENSLRTAEFIRSMAMQILSHSDYHKATNTTLNDKPPVESNCRSDVLEQRLDIDENEAKPLLDSEDQKTDEDELPLRKGPPIRQIPDVAPRAKQGASTNPFVNGDQGEAVYENHENVFLRNRTRDSRLFKHKEHDSSGSDTRNISASDSCSGTKTSKIPIACFKYPNKTNLGVNSAENSPSKTAPVPAKRQLTDETPEYLNVKYPTKKDDTLENNLSGVLDEKTYKNASKFEETITENHDNDNLDDENFYGNLDVTRQIDEEDVPPPIPCLPVNPRTLIANQYYERLLSDTDIQKCLLPHNLANKPDECLRNGILIPLLELEAPKQCLFVVVDSIDETTLSGSSEHHNQDSPHKSGGGSRTIAELLANNHHMFPPWLLLACTQRKQSKSLTKMFTGFRKIVIDESPRANDEVQRYIAARAQLPRLRARLAHAAARTSSGGPPSLGDATHPLQALAIRADGCLLYAAKVLDGVADGFIALREIREIPGTLNGLYLWLAQRLFHGRRFNKVRLLLEVLLAAKCGVSEQMLYKCALVSDYTTSREEFGRRMLYLARRSIVTTDPSGCVRIFHASFARWLLDVKHCTRRYLCRISSGHAALAMYYTLEAPRLNALEIHNYIYHLTRLEQHLHSQRKNKCDESEYEAKQSLDLHTLMLVWVLDSGCNIEAALKKDSTNLNTIAEKIGQISPGETTLDYISPTPGSKKEIDNGEWLEALLKAEVLPRDSKVSRTLHDLTRSSAETKVHQMQCEEEVLSPVEEIPDSIHVAASRGDLHAVKIILQNNASSLEEMDSGGGSPLHTAARHGHAHLVTYLLTRGATIDARDNDGWSPLRTAARAGHTEVVDVLLTFGCDVDCVDSDGRTALRAASWAGHESIVVRLLEGGANPNASDAAGRTALTAAAYMGHAHIVQHLHNAGADINARDADGRTALAVAALCPRGAPTVLALLEAGADPGIADRDKATPLHVAAAEGHVDIVEQLLEHEAELEAQDGAGRTALWAAAGAGHAQTTKVLLYWGAAVDGVDSSGRTVLTAAAAHGNADVVRQLLDRGMDERHRDNSGWAPLHYAAFEGHVDVCEALLDAGAKVDETDNDGKGPLMLAAQEGHTRLIELLIDDWDAPVDQKAHDGKTAFRLSSLEGHLEAMSALVSRGCDPSAVDADGRTVLYALCLHGKLSAAAHLIALAVPSHKGDPEGRTPLHVAAWQGHADLVDLLIEVGGANVEERDACSRTALHAAAWRGRTHALRSLLRHGATVDALCSQGATPLGIAAQEGHEECVVMLLEAGADPMQADHCGRTPISVARRAGHAHICRLLEQWLQSKSQGTPGLEMKPCTSMMANLRLSPSLGQESPMVRRRSHSNSEKARHGSSHERRGESQPAVVARKSRRDRDETLGIHAEEDGYACDKDGYMSPLYVSPSRSPTNEIIEKPSVPTDQYFHRDTHMRIILGRDSKKQNAQNESKNKRNGIVTNPAMRLVANVRNGLDNAAANIRRTGVALAASASSNNPAIKTDAFQWRRETPL